MPGHHHQYSLSRSNENESNVHGSPGVEVLYNTILPLTYRLCSMCQRACSNRRRSAWRCPAAIGGRERERALCNLLHACTRCQRWHRQDTNRQTHPDTDPRAGRACIPPSLLFYYSYIILPLPRTPIVTLPAGCAMSNLQTLVQ
jgi:hypothetical protein